jgi:demethylmenaquinone methyltransferase/2-methoxy-6-polyprenyl-1,4-benzoquinol methylase
MSQAESARHFYDRIRGVYDALADASEHEARQLGIRLLAPSGSEQVLEIGCGTGSALVEIAECLAGSGRVFGVDISQGMLDVAGKRVKASAVADRVAELRLADAQQLPYEDRSFDAVFLSFTLELFSQSEIPVVLAEVTRVLRCGGRLGVVAMHDDGRHTVMVELYRFLHRHFPHIIDCQPIDAQGYLERAGFEEIVSEGVSIWGLPVQALVGRTPSGGDSGAK